MNYTTIAGFFTALLISTSPTMAAPVVYFDFDGDTLMDTGTNVQLGSSFTASLYVSDVDSLHGGLISWGTEINFDAGLLSSSGYSIDSSWPLAGSGNMIDNGSGTAELLASSFVGNTGTIKLADIDFNTTAEGSALLSLSELFPDNLSFDAFAGADGYAYDSEVIFNNATVEISAVPLPAAAWLFGSGLLGLAGLARKKRGF